MKFQGDVIITDPMYIIPYDKETDWHDCEYGENLEALGITTYITHDRGDCAGTDLRDGDLFEQGIIKVKGRVVNMVFQRLFIIGGELLICLNLSSLFTLIGLKELFVLKEFSILKRMNLCPICLTKPAL